MLNVLIAIGMIGGMGFIGWWVFSKLPKRVQEGIPRAILRGLGVAFGWRIVQGSLEAGLTTQGGLMALLGIWILYGCLSHPFSNEARPEVPKKAPSVSGTDTGRFLNLKKEDAPEDVTP